MTSSCQPSSQLGRDPTWRPVFLPGIVLAAMTLMVVCRGIDGYQRPAPVSWWDGEIVGLVRMAHGVRDAGYYVIIRWAHCAHKSIGWSRDSAVEINNADHCFIGRRVQAMPAWRCLESPASRLFTQPFIQDTDQRKHQSSASLAFVRGIHRSPVNSPHKGPVARNVSIWWRHHGLTRMAWRLSLAMHMSMAWYKAAVTPVR